MKSLIMHKITDQFKNNLVSFKKVMIDEPICRLFKLNK